MGVSYAKYLASPNYRKSPFKGIIGWALLNKIPTVEDLQEKYAFKYYSTMNKAVGDVNGGTIGANEDATKDTAVAGVYTDENGGANVVLLKDHTEADIIKVSVGMTINLGGNTLEFVALAMGIDILSGQVTVDGRLPGSTVQLVNSDTTAAMTIVAREECSAFLHGGNYIAESSANATVFACLGNLAVSNTIASAKSHSKGNAWGAVNYPGGNITISSSKIHAMASNGKCYGLNNQGNATISNCDIEAYSNYNVNGTTYTEASYGVRNSGTATINDCYTMGAHSGLENHGSLYVNGGTYEGYGHGGFYFGNGTAITYVQNATIRECAMPDGYTDGGAGSNHAGFYIGGGSTANDITVYMDDCNIYGKNQPIVLRGSSGEKNNSLYISNSTVNDAKIRIDNNTHRLYIGAGNNFTAEDTTLPEACVATDEVYQRPES